MTIRALGGFAVLVDDLPVSANAWQSRKARDLLRILVARRGRRVPRLELCELLWPDDDPFRTAHRLSVLLSIVRNVCGPDVLLADQASIALDLVRVRVDVEDLLQEVAFGAALVRDGDASRAKVLLARAERRYAGTPFEDDPYAEWAVPLQEETRGAYLHAVRLLARLSWVDGEREDAAAYLRRLLAVDAFDEVAHRTLVTMLVDWGCHGEARRAFARYVTAMRSIGVRRPDPAILSPRVLAWA